MSAFRKIADIYSPAAPAETPKLRDPTPYPRVLPRIQIHALPRLQTTPQSLRIQTTAQDPRVSTPEVRVLSRIQIHAPPRVQTTQQPPRMQTTAQVLTVQTPRALPPTLIPDMSSTPPHPINPCPKQGATQSAHDNYPHFVRARRL